MVLMGLIKIKLKVAATAQQNGSNVMTPLQSPTQNGY